MNPMTTGFLLLDNLTEGGFRPGTLTVAAARPGCGISTLLLNIFNNAGPSPLPRLFISLDLSRSEILHRLGGVPDNDDRAFEVYSRLSFSELANVVESSTELRGTKLVFVDGLHLLETTGRVQSQRTTALVRELKGLALSLDVAMVVSSNVRWRFRETYPSICEASSVWYLKSAPKDDSGSPFDLPRTLQLRKNFKGISGKSATMDFMFDTKRHRFAEVSE